MRGAGLLSSCAFAALTVKHPRGGLSSLPTSCSSFASDSFQVCVCLCVFVLVCARVDEQNEDRVGPV